MISLVLLGSISESSKYQNSTIKKGSAVFIHTIFSSYSIYKITQDRLLYISWHVSVCMCMCMRVYVYVYVYTCVCVYMCMCVYVCVYMCMCVCMHTCAHMDTCTQVHVCISIHKILSPDPEASIIKYIKTL